MLYSFLESLTVTPSQTFLVFHEKLKKKNTVWYPFQVCLANSN